MTLPHHKHHYRFIKAKYGVKYWDCAKSGCKTRFYLRRDTYQALLEGNIWLVLDSTRSTYRASSHYGIQEL